MRFGHPPEAAFRQAGCAKFPFQMHFPRMLRSFLLAAGLSADVSFAETAIEGHVVLPKSRLAPVVNRRYEVVTKGGVVATHPPLAVVYLEGAFPKPAGTPTRQIIQKDLTFAPTLLPVQLGTRVEFPNL